MPPRCSVSCAKATIVSLRARNDVFNVGFRCATEPHTRIWAVDDAAHAVDDLLLDSMGIRVVVRIVGRTVLSGETTSQRQVSEPIVVPKLASRSISSTQSVLKY